MSSISTRILYGCPHVGAFGQTESSFVCSCVGINSGSFYIKELLPPFVVHMILILFYGRKNLRLQPCKSGKLGRYSYQDDGIVFFCSWMVVYLISLADRGYGLWCHLRVGIRALVGRDRWLLLPYFSFGRFQVAWCTVSQISGLVLNVFHGIV